MKNLFRTFAVRVYDGLVGTGIGSSTLIPTAIKNRFANNYRKLSNEEYDAVQSPVAIAFTELWLGKYESSQQKVIGLLSNSLNADDFDKTCRIIFDGVQRNVFTLDSVFVDAIESQLDRRTTQKSALPDGAIAQLIAAFAIQGKSFTRFTPSQTATDIARFADGSGREITSQFVEAVGTIRFTLPELWIAGHHNQVIPEELQSEMRLWANWLHLNRDIATYRHVKNYMQKRGFKRKSYVLVSANPSNSYLALLADVDALLETPLNVPADLGSKKPSGRSVFYMLHNSLPWDSQGYATRSHGLIKALNSKGWLANAVTRLGYPFDRHTDLKGVDADAPFVVDGVTYYRLGARQGGSTLPYLNAYAQKALNLIAAFSPDIVHAASNSWNGIVAARIAKALGIPVVYEVRGLWEVTGMSREPGYAFTARYRLAVAMEKMACNLADHVFTLTTALKEELVSRGVDENKISLLPNCVDAERFVPRERNEEIAHELGFEGKTVIGYVGSLLHYEGLDQLLRAAAILRTQRDDFRVLIVGSGAAHEDLMNLAKELNLNDIVTFTGRVPHEVVEDYYSVIDIAPFPRLAQPVCEMVSPLKPFEAMAMEKFSVVSSVAALAEIVNDGVTGLVFEKDNVDDFARVLTRALDDSDLRHAVGKNSREWVLEHRTWAQNADRVHAVYESLLNR